MQNAGIPLYFPSFPLTLKKILYLFIFRHRRKEAKREGDKINVWLPFVCPPQGTWPATQASALTGNQTSDPLVCKPVLNPLSHTIKKNF